MPTVVGVTFKKAGKIYYFDPDGLDLKAADKVIVKTSRGLEFGEVVSPADEVPEEELTTPLKKVVRRATGEDEEQVGRNREKEREALEVCEEKLKKHGLAMKLIDAEYVFDGSKLIFFFTAEGRVDFRELVKDLASVFRTRIELRQIGVRDEAKMIGGLGPCGRRLCCTVFLGDFEPVSIRMAKEQDLPLNPLKISGICGRLMCCLKYEYEAYQDFKKRAPKRGTPVETEFGTGRLVDYNVPRELLVVELESGRRLEIPLAEWGCPHKTCGCPATSGEKMVNATGATPAGNGPIYGKEELGVPKDTGEKGVKKPHPNGHGRKPNAHRRGEDGDSSRQK
ncbi:MAG: stage 0 sporulation family protein [Actinobacteria bacterium]|nr:stage 0 sporulation family protein [Actinomycetota bacterium]